MREYRGLLSSCFHCKRKFDENDPVAVAPFGAIFCVPIYDLDTYNCIKAWSKKRNIEATDFEVLKFKGKKKKDDGHDIEMV